MSLTHVLPEGKLVYLPNYLLTPAPLKLRTIIPHTIKSQFSLVKICKMRNYATRTGYIVGFEEEWDYLSSNELQSISVERE